MTRRPSLGRGGSHGPLHVVVFVLTVGALTGTVCGEEGVPAGAESAPELTPDVIRARLKQVENNTFLQEEEKKKALERYNQALAELELAERHAARAAQFEKEAEGAPAELERLKAALAQTPTPAEVDVPPEATAAELEQRLKELEADLAAQSKAVEELEAALKGRSERKAALPDLITAARKRLAEVEKELAALPKAEGAQPAADAPRTLLKARRRAIEAQIKALEAELRTFDTLTSLLTARRDKGVRALNQLEKRVGLWRKAWAARRAREAEQAEREAAEAQRQAARQHPLIAALAAENKDLAARRTGPEALLSKTEDARRELRRIQQAVERVKQDYNEVQADVGVAGLTEKMGRVLRQRRQRLRDRQDRARNIAARKAELADVLLSLSELRRRQDDLKSVDARVEDLVASLDRALGPQRIQRIADAAREMLLKRKEILGDLVADHEKYSSLLIQLNLAEQELAGASQEFAEYINERVLWVRSGSPLGPAHLAEAKDAAVWFLSPGGWADLGRSLWQDLRAHPLLYALAAAVVGAMALTRRRVRRAVKHLGEQVVRADTDAFAHTVKAAGLTAWLVALGPLAMGLLGWRLGQAGSGTFVRAVGSGLKATAAVFVLIEIARSLCLRNGLGHQHFRWSAYTLRLLRKRFFTPMLFLLPVVFLVATFEAQPVEAHRNSLGRLVLVVGLVVFGVFLERVLRPKGELMRAFLARRSGGWLDRLRYLWYSLAVAVPLALAVAVGAGYYYTAVELARRLVVTLWLVLALMLVYGLTMRVLFMVRRRLAIQRAEQRREAATEEQEGEPAAPGPPAAEEQRASLVAISEQTRRLVRSLVAVAMLVGLWFIWIDVLPALRVLQKFDAWTYGDGTVVTYADLGAALLVAVVTLVAGRNIPGLLEVAVLQHLPLGAGVRFALTTVSRYIITIAGIVVAFAMIGVGWSKVQWLAAAVTVGLGFGLQEIFANFVSGLIILFERPMRVGDVVSVGETTGTVTRIRIRATTITDWDRKELIVPNKEFVTGRLVNWSLSDDLLRLTLSVGVAYGSNTALASELLLACARENPDVLDDPAPSAFFDNFGDSALIFKLRFYISGIRQWLVVRDALHRAVDEAFRRHGIEIAFPQRDVHVRTVRPELAFRLERGGADGGTEGSG